MFSADKGGEDVQVVVGGVKSYKDGSVVCAKHEDDCVGDVMVEIWEGEGHLEGVGDGSSSGRNSGSFIVVVFTAVRCVV